MSGTLPAIKIGTAVNAREEAEKMTLEEIKKLSVTNGKWLKENHPVTRPDPRMAMREASQEIDLIPLFARIEALELKQGQEHDVFHDTANKVAVKFTLPGKTGARSGQGDYQHQITWLNQRFHDDTRVVDTVILPGETESRLCVTQTWRSGRESTMPEIDGYMVHMGLLKHHDGAWFDERDEVFITDALPKNFITTPAGRIHPIDLLASWPKGNILEYVENVVRNFPQPKPAPLAEPMP